MELVAHFTPEELPVTITIFLVGVSVGAAMAVALVRRGRR
jgi:hypothetical protein